MKSKFRLLAPLTLVGLLTLAAPGSVWAATDPQIPQPANNADQLIVEPTAGEAPYLAAINSAQSTIDVEMYMLSDTNIQNALIDAATNRNVKVRVILDSSPDGSASTATSAKNALTSAGIQVQWAPSRFAYDHAKSLVVDGKTAIFGSANYTGAGLNTNREYDVQTTDTNEIQALEEVFQDDWTNTLDDSAPRQYLILSPGSEPAILNVINHATTRLYMEEEEAPDAAIAAALVNAGSRGVDVQLLEANTSDNLSGPGSYQLSELAAQGVKVGIVNTPYLHAKMIIADDEVEMGSENVSSNSLDNNREIGAYWDNPNFLPDVLADFAQDAAVQQPVSGTVPTATSTTLFDITQHPTQYTGQLVQLTATIEGISGDTAYIAVQQDDQATGMELYMGDVNADGLQQGDVVNVTAFVDEYNGQLEINAVNDPEVTGTGTLPNVPTLATGSSMSDYVGLLVQVSGNLTNTNGNFVVNDGSGNLNVTNIDGTTPTNLTASTTWSGTGLIVPDGNGFALAPVTMDPSIPVDSTTYAPLQPQASIVTLQDLNTNESAYQGQVITVQNAVVAAISGTNLFLTQNGYGMRVYPADSTLKPGDVISFKGTVATYNGDTEIDDPSNLTKTGTTTAPTPVVIPTSGVSAANNYVYAKVTGTVTKVSGSTVTLDDGSGPANVFVSGTAPVVGQTFSAYGPIELYNGTAQLLDVDTSAPAAPVVALADLIANPSTYNGKTITVSNGLVSAVLGSDAYLMSGSTGLQVYVPTSYSGALAGGDLANVTGKVSIYKGTPEITLSATPAVVSTGNTVTPVQASATDVSATDLSGYLSVTGIVSAASGKTFTLTDTNNHSTTVYATSTLPANGSAVTVTGIVAAYGTSYELDATDVKVVPAPAAPASVSVEDTTIAGTNLSWGAVTGGDTYNVYENGQLLASGLTTPAYTVSNLTPGTSYSFTVTSVGIGGESTQSDAVTVNTLTVAPTVVQAADTTNVGTNLTWDAVQGASTYNVYENGQLLVSGLTAPAYNVSNLTPGESYSFTVTAVDLGGESAPSDAVTVNTLPFFILQQSVDSQGATVTGNYGDIHVSAVVPVGAFHSSALVTVNEVVVSDALQMATGIQEDQVPLSFGVEFDGEKAKSPIVVTLDDPSIPATAAVYEWDGKQLKPVTAQVTNGQIIVNVTQSTQFVVLSNPLPNLR